MLKTLTKSYLQHASLLILTCLSGLNVATSSQAATKPEYLASFDPAKGFRPAQSDLTEVFLQLAGSLEAYGSPMPYLRHMQAEHARIEAKYRARFGKEPKSYLPASLNDAALDLLDANWKALAPKLGLEALAKKTGNLMRDAILGTRGTGTILVAIFNRQQEQVYAGMTGKLAAPPDFDALQAELVKRLYLGQTTIHDENFALAERDAVGFIMGAQDRFLQLFATLDKSLSPADAKNLKDFVLGVCTDTGRMAQSELQAGIIEAALDRQAKVAAKPASGH